MIAPGSKNAMRILKPCSKGSMIYDPKDSVTIVGKTIIKVLMRKEKGIKPL